MHATMVPDLYQSAIASGGVPFAQPASDQHTKTLDAIWRQHASQAAFSELPSKQLTPCGGLWPGGDVCGAPVQASLVPGQTSLYPARAMPPSSTPMSRVGGAATTLGPSGARQSQEPMKDLTSPLFVDTTVEYDLPKEAYPPQHSAPLLIVHPQYYEHLRHRRTLGAGCVCQLCNFYGRRAPTSAAPAAAPATSAGSIRTADVASTADAATVPTFQKPVWPAGHYQQPLHHQHQLQQAYVSSQYQLAAQHQQLVRSQNAQHHLAAHPHQQHVVASQPHHPALVQPHHQQLVAQQSQLAQHQQRMVPQQQQQQQQQRLRVQHGAPAPRFSCLLERSATFVTPSVSCDSDSGYSSVELDPGDWCQRGIECQAPPTHAADADARDILAKRKRRHDQALEAVSKRQRLAVWQGEYTGCAV